MKKSSVKRMAIFHFLAENTTASCSKTGVKPRTSVPREQITCSWFPRQLCQVSHSLKLAQNVKNILKIIKLKVDSFL